MKRHLKTILLWTLTVLLLGGCLLALYCTGFFEAAHSMEGIRAYIDRSAPWSHLVFFLVQLASVIVAPIPSNVTALAGGVLFGTLAAFLLTWGAVVLGSLTVFFLSRALGQSFIQTFVGAKLSERYLGVLPLWAMIALGAAGVAAFVLALIYGDRIEQRLLARFKK